MSHVKPAKQKALVGPSARESDEDGVLFYVLSHGLLELAHRLLLLTVFVNAECVEANGEGDCTEQKCADVAEKHDDGEHGFPFVGVLIKAHVFHAKTESPCGPLAFQTI